MDVLGDFSHEERGECGEELSTSEILWRVGFRLALIGMAVGGGLMLVRHLV
jgi:hypothetical protein